MIRVLSAGLLTSVQDPGRRGHAALGVGNAGAMDPVALRLANILVGNVDNATALEVTLRGPRLRFETDAVVAVAGAPLEVRCGGAAVPGWRPVRVRAGTEFDCGGMRCGARSYLAVGGGFDVEPVLGSRSVDINAALGPGGGRALAAGDVLSIAAPATSDRSGKVAADAPQASATGFVAANWSIDPTPWFDADTALPYALLRGAHFDRLESASQRALFDQEFHVGNDSNRVGYRLTGPRLSFSAPFELVSTGIVPGTLQLPPAGAPIVLMAEAPTTGGYPRIAHVETVDLARLAQRRPGDRIRFVETSLADAQSRYLERERALAALARSVRDRLD